MKCPFRKIISTTKELREDGIIIDEATTEVFAECLKDECPAYYSMGTIPCALIEHRIRHI
ncbi:MAG: hypothetical protein E7167_01310 [Firmicutes bacterium]|nr:hypothetical protein [Bacillota bacterium]